MEIKLINVSKDYFGVPVLREVCWDILPGDFVAVQGETGAGKTTLLSIAAGLLRPSAGRVYYDGRLASSWVASRLRRRIGYVAQSPVLFAELDVQENAMLAAGLRDGAKDGECRRLLEAFGLWKKRHFRPARLSGGEVQKAALVRALLSPGEVLVLDEPTANLDAAAVEVLAEELAALNGRGVTVVMATHSAAMAEAAREVFVLAEGRLRRRPASRDGGRRAR